MKMYYPKFKFVSACLSCYVSLIMSGVCLSWLEPLGSWYQSLDSEVPMTEGQVSMVVSLVEAGAFFSPLPTGLLADRIGRKWTLLISAVVALVSFLIAIFTRSVVGLCIARVLSGFALGAAPTVAPVYLAEISPPRIRGALSGQLITMFFIGQLIVYVSGHYMSYTGYLWVCIASPVAFIATILYSPESPSYLLKTKQTERALEAVKQLRSEAEFDMAEFEAAKAGVESEEGSGGGWRVLMQPKSLEILLVLQLLSFVSHANGLPTLSLYATTTFGGREWLTLGMGGVLTVSSFLAAFLTDPIGRRPLLVFSLVGSALATALLAAYFYTFEPWLLYVGVVSFCVISSVGISPLVMTLQGELFPASTRSIASGITELTLSLSSFVSLIVYIPISNAFGMGVNFIIYTILSLVGVLIVVFYLPETAGINIDAR